MSITRIMFLLRNEMRMGPRSGVFLMALIAPGLLSLIIQLVFGTLFDAEPRLGIVDLGQSEITEAAGRVAGVELTLCDDVDGLKERVAAHDLDAGLVLPPDFDAALRAGERPRLNFFLSGESLAFHRFILAGVAIDLVRGLEGAFSPVEIVERAVGDASALPLSDRLVPLIIFYALMIASLVVPSFSIVTEREQGTLGAILVTPVRLFEVLIAKGIFGMMLGMIMTLVALAMNGALDTRSPGLLLVLLVAALMCTEIALIYASLSKDVQTLYVFIKGFGVVLFAPVLWYLFPSWPAWGAKLFPTYWIIDPIYELSVKGAPLREVAGTLAVALAICLGLFGAVGLLVRRMQTRLASG